MDALAPALPLSRAELEAVTRPLGEASQLPSRAYDDPRVLEAERRAIFGRSWVAAGLEQELSLPGACSLLPLSPSGTIVVRGPDLALRALENICLHRGAPLLERACGRQGQLVCPYHGWAYELDGRLSYAPHMAGIQGLDRASMRLPQRPVEASLGLLFVGPSGAAPPLGEALAGLGEQLSGKLTPVLHLGRRNERDVAANWKLLAENFLESHHFPFVHPELERLTPSRLARTLPSQGRWLGGTMDLDGGAETVSKGGLLDGRPLVRRDGADRRVYDYFVWPNLMLSLQPDYLLVYRLYPLEPGRTRVIAERYFHPEVARGDHDLSGVLDLWDLIDAQDQRVCEGQQRALCSRPEALAPYAEVEESMHAFDRWVAEALLSEQATRGRL